MGRTIAIDFGLKRTGIATTDPLGMIATGLTTIQTHEVPDFLAEYFRKEKVDMVVIGQPKRMDNSDSAIEKDIIKFIKKLCARFPGLHVERMDERFTSKLAVRAMVDGGMKKMKRRNKAIIDKISATIILQSWLEYKSNNKIS